ncbi:MAG TPA: hypothetical protein VK815_07935 [Candidatus Acidoferrales bacterium]|jgi:hypothetical protein|nr:hypothetical protein [Candidatus Acidoferrales bacterium]
MADSDKALKLSVDVDVTGKEKLHQITQLIGKVTTPELGEALGATLEGPIGIATAAVIAFNALSESIRKTNEELDKIGEKEIAGHLAKINAVRDAWDEVKTKQAEYIAQLADAGQDGDPVGTQIRRIKEIEAAQLESDKNVIESLGKVIEQKIRAAGGSEAEVEAARQHTRAAIDDLNDAGASRSIADKEKILSDARINEPGLENAEVVAEKAARQAAGRYALEKGNLDELQKPGASAALDDKITAAEDALSGAKYARDFGTNKDDPALMAAAQKKVQEAETELALQQQIMANTQARLAQLEILVPKLEQENANAKQAWEDAQRATLLNKHRLGTLPGEIEQDKSVTQIRSGGRAAAGVLGDDVGKVIAADTALLAGRQLDANQTAQIAALKVLLEKAHENSTQILNLIMDGVKKHESVEQILSEVQARLANARSNIQG